MKRIIAIALALVMLLPLCLTAKAETTAIKPFYAGAWAGVDREKFPNMTAMPSVYIYPQTGIDPYFYYGGVDTVKYPMARLAIEVRKSMNALPQGMRYMQFLHPRRIFDGHRVDFIDLEDATQVLKGMITEFLQEYKSRGGLLDGIIMDLEYIEVLSWYVYAHGYKNNPNIYKDIAENETYRTKIRPRLVERGFKFWPNPSGSKSELWSIYPYVQGDFGSSRGIWDAVMSEYLAECLNEAIYKPMKEYYPDTHMSDYQTTDFYGWNKELNREGGGTYAGGNRVKAGDTSNLNTYFVQPSTNFYMNGTTHVYKNPFAYNKAVYEADSYNMFLWDMNRFKNMYNSTDTGRINIWISEYDTNLDSYAERESSTCNTPYYAETILHTGLMNPDLYLLYIVDNERGWTTEDYNKRYQVVHDCLNELTKIVGAADRKPIALPTNWNDGFVLSGMYAGGRNVWRITPDTTDGMTLANFKVKDKAPTFKINGKTVIFPQGRIIETGKVATVGTCGYWVETPTDVMPVVITDADRFGNNPSYIENFERYSANTTFSASNVKEKDAWDLYGTLKVISSSGNKMLSMTGSSSAYNLKLPANISAGDNYAKQQAWEVSFKLPAVLSGGSVNLLTNGADTGFKISGTNLYYDKNGTATQFDGLTLAAGTKYTVRREVNLANNTCTYLVFANGAQVAKAENIKMKSVSLPVEKIGFKTTGLGSQIIYLDDYKLYPMGFTADFEVYNAKTGIILADMTKAASTDVAYRLSWLNNTGTAKKATVVAQYYKNGALNSSATVGEFVMAPGDDGVETAIVKNKSGMTVKLVLQTKDTTLPAVPNYDDGYFGWVNYGSSQPPEEPTVPDETVEQTQPSTQPPEESTGTVPEESTDVPAESTGNAPEASTDGAPVESTDGADDGAQGGETADPTTPETAKPRNTDTILWVIAAVIGVALIGGAVAAGMILLKKKQPSGETEITDAPDEE